MVPRSHFRPKLVARPSCRTQDAARRRRSKPIVVLGAAALTVLCFPPSYAAGSAESCAEVSSVPLRDEGGRAYRVVHRRCDLPTAIEQVIEVCDGDDCRPDRCAPANEAAGSGEHAWASDVWIEPPAAIRLASGAQDVIVVRRMGQGAYPHIARWFVAGGEPRCEDAVDLEAALERAAVTLAPHESFGARGADVEIDRQIDGDRLILIQGVYLPEDPNCCPSGGYMRVLLEVVLDVDGVTRRARVERIERSATLLATDGGDVIL